MVDSYNIQDYLKVIIGIIGALAAIVKIRENFTAIKRKQELKLDLEILEKIKLNKNFNSSEIEEKINSKLNKAFEEKSESLTNFFTGIGVFIGFGFWSYDIFKNSESFDAWIILTLICSLTGLALIFDSENKKEEKELFYKIGLYDKANFKFAIILTVLTGILTSVLVWKLEKFTFWQFLSGLLFFIGIATIFKYIKRL